MPRWIPALLVVFALAAFVSLLAAWGIAMLSPRTGGGPEVLRLDDPLVKPHLAHQPRHAPFTRAMTVMTEGRGWRRDVVMAFNDVYAGGPHNHTRRTLHRAGWPWLSFQGEEWVIRGEPGPSRGLIDAPLFLRPIQGAMGRLVWRPIWPGFLLNTAIIALAPAMIVLFFPVRRVVRRRRGCCAWCGYNLEGLDRERTSGRCPECGAESVGSIG